MIDTSALNFRIDPMRQEDIDAVMQIEYESFTAPWSARAYAHELDHNRNAHYLVARALHVPPVPFWRRALPLLPRGNLRAPLVGYGGFWMVVDEAHISTIAVRSRWRRRGIGELLLIAMIDRAAELNAVLLTLEVRVTNLAAQALYRKYGFQVVGSRTRYYQDDGEDAYIMTTPPVQGEAYRAFLREHAAVLLADLAR